MAADPSSLWDPAKIGGGTIVGAIATAFVKNFFTGAGVQEKDLRSGLSERVAALEEKVEHLEKNINDRTRERDAWRWLALEARLYGNTLAAKHGEAMPTWPPDPPGGAP